KKAGQGLQQARRRLIHLGPRPASRSRFIIPAGEELAGALSALLVACVARYRWDRRMARRCGFSLESGQAGQLPTFPTIKGFTRSTWHSSRGPQQIGVSALHAAVVRTEARYENPIAPRLESTGCTEHVLRRADRAPGRCRAGGGLLGGKPPGRLVCRAGRTLG